MAHSHADIDRHVRAYLVVFAALLALTAMTVGAWKYIDLPKGLTIGLALSIAMAKASLVACFFMHLISEKKMIFWVLALTVSFFFVLLLVPMLTSMADQVAS